MNPFTFHFEMIQGVPVLQLVDSRRKTSTVSLVFRAGYRFDTGYKLGTAHFFEHLLMKQTSMFSDPIDRLLKLESLGIDAGAYTNLEAGTYNQSQRSQYTRESLQMLLRDWRTTEFSQEYINAERNVIQNERAEQEDDLMLILSHALTNALFPNHPIASPILGTQQSIGEIALEDIRRFYKSYYTPENMMIVLLVPEYTDVQAIVKKEILHIVTARIKVDRQPVDSVVVPESVISYNGSRSAVGIGFRTVSVEHPLRDRIALNILKNYFANCWSSLFIRRLRHERSLAYWADGQTHFFLEGGSLQMLVQCETSFIDAVRELMLEAVEEVRSGHIDSAIFNVAKEIHLTAIAEEQADPINLLWERADALLLGIEPDDPEQYWREALTITKEEVLNVARTFLDQERMVVVVAKGS